MSGKRALITGGSSGIGAAVADTLRQEGLDVAITHLPGENFDASAKILRFPLDVRNVEEIANVVDLVEAELGPIDVLVNSAGINFPQYALDVDERTWDHICDVNTKGLFFVCQEVGRRMINKGLGDYAIVNIASQMGLVGYERRAVYCASKAAVVNLTKVLAIEWAMYGIRVNAVAPTFVETRLTAPMFEEAGFLHEVRSRSPWAALGNLRKSQMRYHFCVVREHR